MTAELRRTMDTTAAYRITAQGHLDENWSERLGGISIQVQVQPNGVPVTVLAGTVRDQSALAGVLDTLYNLGLPLISVESLGIQPVENSQEDPYFGQSSRPG